MQGHGGYTCRVPFVPVKIIVSGGKFAEEKNKKFIALLPGDTAKTMSENDNFVLKVSNLFNFKSPCD